MTAKAKKRLSPDAEYVLDLLVAAGHITREKAFHARDIALEYGPAGEPCRADGTKVEDGCCCPSDR